MTDLIMQPDVAGARSSDKKTGRAMQQIANNRADLCSAPAPCLYISVEESLMRLKFEVIIASIARQVDGR